MRRGAAGFTLLEMLAVILLVGVVITAAANFYLQLSRASNAAAERMRETRRTTVLLDRIARDLEAALLVAKPDGVDPLDHPWVFLAEASRSGEGADRLRFATRNRRTSTGLDSDFAVVTYGLREGPEGDSELVHWSSPHLPEALDRSVPLDDEEGAHLLASGVLAFGVRFLANTGQWKDAWDSSQLDDASQLPVAAEIQLALAPEGADAAQPQPIPLVRSVVLALRPLDLATLLSGEEGQQEDEDDEDEEDEDGPQDDVADDETQCVTVGQCLAKHPEIDPGPALDAAGLPRSVLSSVGGQCAATFGGVLPLPADCL